MIILSFCRNLYRKTNESELTAKQGLQGLQLHSYVAQKVYFKSSNFG